MKKQINIQATEQGQKYFFIYEVRAKKHNGEIITHDRYFNEKEANNSLEFAEKVHKKLYRNLWIMKQIVWI